MTQDSPSSRRWVWLSLLLPLIGSAIARELWAPDEPRYAEVAREIWSRGGWHDWIVMHLCGDVYPDKPPLLYWLAGLGGRLTGWSEWGLRLPSILATAGSAWLTALLARRWWGTREAFWAPILFLSTALVAHHGGRLQIDPLLSFWILAAIVLATLPAAGNPRRSTRGVLAAGLCMGLAALAKGPVAWLHVLVPLILWGLLAPIERPRIAKRAYSAMILLAVAPVAIWAFTAIWIEPSLKEHLLFGEHVGRVVQGQHHLAPFWTYLVQLPPWAMPWTALVVLGIVTALGKGRDLGLWRAALWFCSLFIIFSLMPPKRDLYLLPVYPALALLAARALVRTIDRGQASPWVLLPGPLLYLVLGTALAASGLFLDELPGLAWRGPLVALPLLVAGGIALRSTRQGRISAWASAQAVGWGAFTLALAIWVYPPLNAKKSGAELARWLAERPEHPHAIATLGVQPESFRFYGGVPAVRGRLDALRESEGAQFLGLVRRRDWEGLPQEVRDRFRILEQREIGSRVVLVLGAR